MASKAAVSVTPPDVAAFLVKSRVPRARAAAKLADVLARAASGIPPLNEIREIWVFGSFARGALAVGDVDLHMRVDVAGSPAAFMLDAFYGRRPFAAHIKALGCGGPSRVSIRAHPAFGQPGEPCSPERLATADARARHGAAPTSPPAILHMVTNEPLAGPFVLLWARGDRLAWALDRLAALPADPAATRHERTTTAPLLDDLAPKLGIETAFALAPQVRAGNVRCRALLPQDGVVPERARLRLERRYPAHRGSRPSPRAAAAASAIRWLADEGADLDEIVLVDEPVTADGEDEQAIRIDFNPFSIYLAGSGRFPSGFRLVHVWPARARGPWLAFELVVVDQVAAEDLYDSIHRGGTPADRAARLLGILGDVG